MIERVHVHAKQYIAFTALTQRGRERQKNKTK